MTVAKDIHITCPVSPLVGFGGLLVPRTGTVKAEAAIGEDELGRKEKDAGYVVKSDNNADNLFIEDVG